jgi:MoaA/NifB/PqqE/SkfB family radical SAM enzyme
MSNPVSFWPQCDQLSIEVTTHCNSSCSHCFVRARGKKKNTLSPKLVQTIIREGYEAGYRRLHLTGGEPLLWEGLLKILDYAFDLGYKTAFLNTNGTLLTNKISRDLANFSGLTVSITLQGPKRFHDSIRGKGSYDKAMKGVEKALDAGLSIDIFTPVDRSLIPELPHFAGKLFDSHPDIKQLTFIQLIRVSEDVFDLSKDLLRPDDFLRLVRLISLLNLYGMKVGLLHNPLAAVVSQMLKFPWTNRSPPLYRAGSIMITAEGGITLAHSATEHFGTYEAGILSTLINSNNYWLAVSEDQLICRNCRYNGFCKVEGMMRPSEWFRDLGSHVPYCKRVLDKASSYC